jgi:ABC-type cobalamin/Fe3+-siderophores transport system ATPase subunit
MSQLRFAHVSFTHDSLQKPLIDDLTFTAPAGWTGIVGPNGVGKSTLLALATGALEPQVGDIIRPSSSVSCDQRTDTPPAELTELLSFPDASAGRLVSMLAIDGDWP